MVIYEACPGHNLCIYAWISKLFCTVVVLEEEKCHLKHFYAPNFGEVEGAYWFGPVCPSVRLSVHNTWQLRNSRTAYARILKFYMWHLHEK